MLFWRDMRRRIARGFIGAVGRRRGFFIPHRHAGDLRPPLRYAALEGLFKAVEPVFQRTLAEAGPYLETLRTLQGPPPQPRFDQDWFPRLDAAIAYAIVRNRRPARIVELGSGHSTRFLARAIADGGLQTRLIAIDPAPRANLEGLGIEWTRATLQTAGLQPFMDLQAGDIAFIDSSHVLMPGTDVDLVLNEVLPQLPSGVLVHFHDIFLPEPYPQIWTWRGYNEQNAVASLMMAGGWRPFWSSRWAATRMQAEIAATGFDRLPLLPSAYESSLWLEKL